MHPKVGTCKVQILLSSSEILLCAFVQILLSSSEILRFACIQYICLLFTHQLNFSFKNFLVNFQFQVDYKFQVIFYFQVIFLFSGGWLTKVPTLGLKSEAPGFKLPFGRLLACSFVDLKMEFFLRINWNCELGV